MISTLKRADRDGRFPRPINVTIKDFHMDTVVHDIHRAHEGSGVHWAAASRCSLDPDG